MFKNHTRVKLKISLSIASDRRIEGMEKKREGWMEREKVIQGWEEMRKGKKGVWKKGREGRTQGGIGEREQDDRC